MRQVLVALFTLCACDMPPPPDTTTGSTGAPMTTSGGASTSCGTECVAPLGQCEAPGQPCDPHDSVACPAPLLCQPVTGHHPDFGFCGVPCSEQVPCGAEQVCVDKACRWTVNYDFAPPAGC